eukprot:COSAG06_NODE_20222_length_803_cov_7.471591_2_plen_108_part_01
MGAFAIVSAPPPRVRRGLPPPRLPRHTQFSLARCSDIRCARPARGYRRRRCCRCRLPRLARCCHRGRGLIFARACRGGPCSKPKYRGDSKNGRMEGQGEYFFENGNVY